MQGSSPMASKLWMCFLALLLQLVRSRVEGAVQSCCHCTGTRLLRLRLAEPVLAARMGAPATVNIVTPHALLALPLHPPRLVKTLQQLGLLSLPDSLQRNTDQAAAATTYPGAALVCPLNAADATRCWSPQMLYAGQVLSMPTMVFS